MSNTEEKKVTKMGRPKKPKDELTNQQFHLVLLDEEMELIKAATKLSGSTSAAAFMRGAIRVFAPAQARLAKNIPEELMPLAEQIDKPKKHFPLLLSAEDRGLIDEYAGGSSVFIRTAALAMAFANPGRNEAFESAEHALREKKGSKAPEAPEKPKRRTAKKEGK